MTAKPIIGLTTEQRAYAHNISIHCPNASETEMQARCEIARIRDECAVGISRGSEHIGGLLGDVSRLATQAVYAPMSLSRLMALKAALQLGLDTARVLERGLRV